MPWPSFPSFVRDAQKRDAVPGHCAARRRGSIDLAAVRAAVTPRTRLLFVATPNNPTGRAVPRDELIAFVRDLPEHVLPVIDEAYFDYLDPADRLDAIADLVRGGRRRARAADVLEALRPGRASGRLRRRAGGGRGRDAEGAARLRRRGARPGGRTREPRRRGRGRAAARREPGRGRRSHRRCSGRAGLEPLAGQRRRTSCSSRSGVDADDRRGGAARRGGGGAVRARRSARRRRCGSAPARRPISRASTQRSGVAGVQRGLTPCKPRRGAAGGLRYPGRTGARRPFPYADDTQERRRPWPLRKRQRQDAAAAGPDRPRHDLPPAASRRAGAARSLALSILGWAAVVVRRLRRRALPAAPTSISTSRSPRSPRGASTSR